MKTKMYAVCAVIFMISFLSPFSIAFGQTQSQHPPQLEYYPIIFIHGHAGVVGVEDTWKDVTEKLNNTNGFVYQGKLWEKTQLPNNLPAKSIFSFNFYRSNDNEIMGSNKGKIGAIPIAESEIPSMIDSRIDVTLTISTSGKIGFSWEYNLSDYKRSYFFDNRASYAERLKVAVNNVMQATHAKKVIFVAHSMGGLVARAYIRWIGGEQKVFKLLTIATPNHGIVDDGRAAL